MKTPTVSIKPTGQHFALHVTYDATLEHTPAAYDNESWAMYVAGVLQGRFDKAPEATMQTYVGLALDTAREFPGLHGKEEAPW